MAPSPQIGDVLEAKNRVGQIQLAVAHYLFSYSWAASYVRLVEIEAAVHTTLPVALAHALWNDPSSPDYAPEEWLPNITIQAKSITAVQQLIAHAISDFSQASDLDGALSARLHSLQVADAMEIYEIQSAPGAPRPAAPRQYGPTYQVMWQTRGRFYFLEVHNES